MAGEGSDEQATPSGCTNLHQGPESPQVPDSEGSLVGVGERACVTKDYSAK